MNFVILFLLFILSFLNFSISHADTVLVPAENVEFSEYQEKCQKTGYICTNQYFLNQIQSSETPLFDDLINKIDLSSKEYLQHFETNLLNTLENEMISVDQLEMLLKLISQILELKSDKKLTQIIETDLKNIQKFLAITETIKDSKELVVIFKKVISLNQIKNLKISSIKIPLTKLHFSSSPINTNIRSYNINSHLSENSTALLKGECENQTIHPRLANVTWSAFSGQHCSLSEGLTLAADSTSHFYQENKKIILGSAILVGAVLLLNKYEVQFQF